MKIKKHWIAIQIQHEGKYDACIIPVTDLDNIAAKLSAIRGLLTANIFDTQKAAIETVKQWVDCFKAEGTYRWNT